MKNSEMMKVEFQDIIKSEITARWPKWTYSLKDLDDWFAKFKKEDIELLKKAIQEYRIAEEPTTPKMLGVAKYLAKLKRNQATASQKATAEIKGASAEEGLLRIKEKASIETRIAAYKFSEKYKKIDPEIGELLRGEKTLEEIEVKRPEKSVAEQFEEIPF